MGQGTCKQSNGGKFAGCSCWCGGGLSIAAGMMMIVVVVWTIIGARLIGVGSTTVCLGWAIVVGHSMCCGSSVKWKWAQSEERINCQIYCLGIGSNGVLWVGNV